MWGFSQTRLKKEQGEGKEGEGEGGNISLHYHQGMSFYIPLKFTTFSSGFVK
jgi:hypothetical protein